MRFTQTDIPGVWLIDPEPREDERGFFARTWCHDEFVRHGLDSTVVQCNISYNRKRGTLRGMHYQVAPHEEPKLVRVTRGAIHDVVVDLREGSPTRWQWVAAELTAENRRALHVGAGFAHGFQTLCDDTEVLYQMGAAYHPQSARGLRWDDPALAIDWPLADAVVSERDRSYPLLAS